MGIVDKVKNLKVTDIGHYLAGIIVGYLSQVDPVLSVIGFATFVIYELDEDWHIKDGAWRDIKAFGLGVFTVGVYMIRKLLGIHIGLP